MLRFSYADVSPTSETPVPTLGSPELGKPVPEVLEQPSMMAGGNVLFIFQTPSFVVGVAAGFGMASGLFALVIIIHRRTRLVTPSHSVVPVSSAVPLESGTQYSAENHQLEADEVLLFSRSLINIHSC
jgi:hypothetical protein